MSLLDKTQTPDDLRGLSAQQLDKLAGEIREFIVANVSRGGGHLASNLGVVELTLALFLVFDFKRDRIVWDVGHQCYTYKMFTGRRAGFKNLRQLDGMSGFPKTEESPYDHFNTGHSSTSVAAAYGLAKSRDLKGQDHSVVAVIGDGAMTGGLAYEAMNNIGKDIKRCIVILNDNNMSISENVGGLSRYLNRLRTAPGYMDVKRGVNRFLRKIPGVGAPLAQGIEKIKNTFKYSFLKGILFEELGFRYIGPIDGHNIEELREVLLNVRDTEYPVVLHVLTKKGRGYKPAEEKPERFHGVGKFDVETGKSAPSAAKSYSELFGRKLLSLAEQDKRILAISAAMTDATGLGHMRDKFPERVFDVGIAEAFAVTYAAGLAINGMKPVFAVYSSFLQRAYDQLLHDVCLQNLGVVFAVDRAGIVGQDGETHQGVFDLSYLSHMPNMRVFAPKDGHELELMLEQSLKTGGPTAIRYPRAAACEVFDPPNEKNRDMTQPELIVPSNANVAIAAVGTMCEYAAEAVKELAKLGIKAALINPRQIKPINPRLLDMLAGYGCVFTVEDNAAIGGFGMALESALGRKVHKLAFPDEFIPQGTREQLFERYGLNTRGIVREITKICSS